MALCNVPKTQPDRGHRAGDTPGSRPQLALAGCEGTPEPPEMWCPEWSLGGPAVMTTAGPLPPPSPHPGAAAGVNCWNPVDPTRKQVPGRGRTTPPQGWLSPGRRAPESLSPAPPRREGHAVRSSGSRCPAHKPWGDYTHTHTHACTHTHAVPAQQGPGGQAESGCRLREEAHPWGPPGA